LPYSPSQPRDDHGRFAEKNFRSVSKQILKAQAKSNLKAAAIAYEHGFRTGVPHVDAALKGAHIVHNLKEHNKFYARLKVGKNKVMKI
jgi:hypothetical protein